jgi:hypothetical protein
MSRAVSTTGVLIKRATLNSNAALTSSAIGTPGVFTSGAAHNLVIGSRVTISGHEGAVPAVAGDYIVETVPTATTFTLSRDGDPVDLTAGGTGGTFEGHGALTTIAEIVTLTPPGKSRNKIPTTTHNDGAESSVLGILMQRDPVVRVNWLGDEPTHQQIEADINANARAYWRIDMPSGIKMGGPGRVQRFEPVDAPTDAAQQLEFAIAWAGLVLFEYPAAV